MSFTDDDWLVAQCDAVKTLFTEAFANASTPAPFGRVVTFPSGPPSWDCEMIAVWTSLRHGGGGTVPDQRPIKSRAVKTVLVVNTDFLRCVTSLGESGIPEADVVNADGERIETDKWIAWRTMTVALATGTIFNGCSATHMQPLQPLASAGNLAGFRLTTEVTLG